MRLRKQTHAPNRHKKRVQKKRARRRVKAKLRENRYSEAIRPWLLYAQPASAQLPLWYPPNRSLDLSTERLLWQ